MFGVPSEATSRGVWRCQDSTRFCQYSWRNESQAVRFCECVNQRLWFIISSFKNSNSMDGDRLKLIVWVQKAKKEQGSSLSALSVLVCCFVFISLVIFRRPICTCFTQRTYFVRVLSLWSKRVWFSFHFLAADYSETGDKTGVRHSAWLTSPMKWKFEL